MMMRGLKSSISVTCRSVMPPEIGTTVQPRRLRPVMRAEAAGEEAVAVGDVADVAGTAARGADRAGDDVGPDVDVAPRVADDGGLAGGARGGVDAAELLARDGEHAERVGVAQVCLGGEGELREIGELLQVVRVDAVVVEALPVEGRVLVGVAERPFHAVELERRDLVAGGCLDRVEDVAGRGQVVHSVLPSLSGSSVALMVREWPRNSATTAPSARVTWTS